MPRRPKRGPPAPAPAGFGRDETGAAILEFALVLPILIALVFSGFELGRALLVQQALEGAVRGGARYLSRVPDPTCRPACSAEAAHAIRTTRDAILADTRLSPEAVEVRSVEEPPPGTVILTGSVSLRIALAGWRSPPVWTLQAAHQEARVEE